MKRTSLEIEKQICNLYKPSNGHELAKIFNLEIHTIYKILKRNNMIVCRKKLTNLQELEIINLYKDGKNGYEIGNILNVNCGIVYNTLKRNNIKTREMSQIVRKYEIDEYCFDIIDSEWKAYFLGLFYADGCITKNSAKICLVENDKDILELLNNYIHKNRPLSKINKKQLKNKLTGKIYYCKPQMALEINNKKINNRLRELGLFERKSLTLKFPDNSIIPVALMPHFIRGYFDGDGCIQKEKYGQRFDVSSSYEFCQSFKHWLMTNLNINSYLEPVGKICKLKVYDKKDIYALYQFLYSKSTIKLNRKFEKFNHIIINFDWTKINKQKYSKFKYVTFDKRRGTWIVNKKINKTTKFFGSFNSENAAIEVAKTLY
jgi:transposase